MSISFSFATRAKDINKIKTTVFDEKHRFQLVRKCALFLDGFASPEKPGPGPASQERPGPGPYGPILGPIMRS